MLHACATGRGKWSWLVGAVVVLAPSARAADPVDFSIKEVPADAAYYSVQLRGREQWEAIARSKAWAKLTKLPLVQTAWQAIMVQWNMPGGPGSGAQQWYQAPENQELVALIGDMLGNEAFTYGGAHAADFVDFSVELYSVARYGPALMQLTGRGQGLSNNEKIGAAVFPVLVQRSDKLAVPEIVFGFKLTQTAPAEKQLKRLEDWAANQPSLKGRLQREKIAGGDFLVVKLDGKLVPWAALLAGLKDHEEKAGQFDAVVQSLSAKKLAVAVGLRKGYLLVSVGESTAPLAKFGQGKRMVDQAALKPLAKFADRPLTSVRYLSKEMAGAARGNKNDLDNYAVLAEAALAKADLSAAKKDRLRKDVKALVQDLKKLVPEPGTMLSFGFRTPRGAEAYEYDGSEHPTLDGSRPLTILNHVGGSPLFVSASRSQVPPDLYPTVVKWVKLLHEHTDSTIVPLLGDEQKERFRSFAKVAGPLMNQLDAATAKLLLPALKDGQSAFVLDARLTSKQWFPGMPPTARPLPLLEPAFVIGVSDAAKLEKAFADYRRAINEFLVAYRKVEQEMPEVQIPAPRTQKLRSGTAYFYPLPEVGLDAQLMPNVAVSGNAATLSLSADHGERLLSATPLRGDGGLLSKALAKPLAGAVYLDWPALVDAIAPWVELGVRAAAPLLPGGDDEDNRAKTVDALCKQVREGLDVLKVFRSYASITYVEGGAVVTHSETVIRDLP